jgi:hypothetical protein
VRLRRFNTADQNAQSGEAWLRDASHADLGAEQAARVGL